MMVLSKVRRTKRVRLARIGLSASALAAMALPVKFATPAEAKTPGSTYCYHGTCHRVKTIAETQALVGVEQTVTASHYDDCSHDRYNPCGLTSSGERFHPERPDNTASPIYPDGTTLLVWSPETEQALVVRVNNAGPYWGDRTLDLSRAAAEKLGFEGKGVAKLRVRVIKAPEPQEAKYERNRTYPPVPGDIGKYASLAQAQTGMAVALALQASAGSPMAPVTTANAFARHGEEAEPLVAEAPQALGRVQVASLLPEPEHHFGAFMLGLPNTHQSHRQIASLSMGRDINQSLWGKDVLDDLATAADNSDKDNVPKPAPAKKPDVAAVPKPVLAKKPVHVAAVEPESQAESKPVAHRQKAHKETSSPASRSRKSQARNERHSRGRRIAQTAERRSRERRYAYAEARAPRRERSAGQLMSLAIRAQASAM